MKLHSMKQRKRRAMWPVITEKNRHYKGGMVWHGCRLGWVSTMRERWPSCNTDNVYFRTDLIGGESTCSVMCASYELRAPPKISKICHVWCLCKGTRSEDENWALAKKDVIMRTRKLQWVKNAFVSLYWHWKLRKEWRSLELEAWWTLGKE